MALKYTITYDGVDGEGNEARIAIPDNAYTGSPFFALTDAPLYRQDKLEFSVAPGTLPTPLPEQVYVSVDGVGAGAWTLVTQQTDVETGAFVTYTGAREFNDVQIADAVMYILNLPVGTSPLTNYRGAYHRRWATILDGDLNGWISRRIQRQGELPSLDTLLRELPKYGYTLTLANIPPFNAPITGVSIVPLHIAAQSVAKDLPAGYRLRTHKEPLINPLTRAMAYIFDGQLFSPWDGQGYDTYADFVNSADFARRIEFPDVASHGEATVLMEMRRYHDYYTQETITAEMPITPFAVRDLVRTGRDNRTWIVESVSHTEVATQLRLIRQKSLPVAQLYRTSAPPYQSAAPANALVPSPPLVRHIRTDITHPTTGETANWDDVGGAALIEFIGARTGEPWLAYEWRLVRQDGTIYDEGTIENPATNASEYILLFAAESPLTLRVRSVNAAKGAGVWADALVWTPSFQPAQVISLSIITAPDLDAMGSYSIDAQHKMLNAITLPINPEPAFTKAYRITSAAYGKALRPSAIGPANNSVVTDLKVEPSKLTLDGIFSFLTGRNTERIVCVANLYGGGREIAPFSGLFFARYSQVSTNMMTGEVSLTWSGEAPLISGGVPDGWTDAQADAYELTADKANEDKRLFSQAGCWVKPGKDSDIGNALNIIVRVFVAGVNAQGQPLSTEGGKYDNTVLDIRQWDEQQFGESGEYIAGKQPQIFVFASPPTF